MDVSLVDGIELDHVFYYTLSVSLLISIFRLFTFNVIRDVKLHEVCYSVCVHCSFFFFFLTSCGSLEHF